MKIELYIDGKKKVFTAPFVPMLAKRKYLEVNSKIESREHTPTPEEIIDDNDAMYSILSDVVFKGQFTIEQLYEGASSEYADSKLTEAVWGIKPTTKREGEEGNDQGE
jgi:hypothetical protein